MLRSFPLLLPLLASLLVLWALDPARLLAPTIPSRGDLTGHVFPVWLMRNELLPAGGLSGWSQGWFAGFPAFYFYFPLPAVVASMLASVFGVPVAMKLVLGAGLLALPFATYYLVRSLGLAPFVAGMAGAAAGCFLFMNSFQILGGNILSTLMGEYSFSWSMAFGIIYLGLVARSANGLRSSPLAPGVVLAAATLSHIFGCMAAVAASLVFLRWKPSRRVVLGSWIVGFGLTGFWSVPFLARLRYTGSVTWLPVEGFLDLLPLGLWPWIPLALMGFWLLVGRRNRGAPLFAAMIALAAMVYFIPHQLFNKGRFLPFAFWAAYVLGGIALGILLHRGSWEKLSSNFERIVLALLPLALGAFSLQWAGSVRTSSASAFQGLEASGQWNAASRLIDRLQREAPGRVYWESSSVLLGFGSWYPFALIPYYTEGRFSSLDGLLMESALGFPFIRSMKGTLSPSPVYSEHRGPPGPLNFDLGVRQLQIYGVSYFITMSESAAALADARPALHLLAEEDPFRLYRVDGAGLVEPARQVPQVYVGQAPDSAFQTWFNSSLLPSTWLVRDGLPEWPRVKDLAWPSGSAAYPEAGSAVSEVSVDPEEVSFTTKAVGIPHLVKISYFPNWSVEGADGPFWAAPSLMVVVPRQEHVILHFERGWAEKAGVALTLLTVLLILGRSGVSLLARRRPSGAVRSRNGPASHP